MSILPDTTEYHDELLPRYDHSHLDSDNVRSLQPIPGLRASEMALAGVYLRAFQLSPL